MRDFLSGLGWLVSLVAYVIVILILFMFLGLLFETAGLLASTGLPAFMSLVMASMLLPAGILLTAGSIYFFTRGIIGLSVMSVTVIKAVVRDWLRS